MFPTPSPELLTPSTSNSYRPPENGGAEEKDVIAKLEVKLKKHNRVIMINFWNKYLF